GQRTRGIDKPGSHPLLFTEGRCDHGGGSGGDQDAKVHQWAQGTQVILGHCIQQEICLVESIQAYMATRGSTDGALFQHNNVMPLT
ncbi:hypothetical protein JRQ81_014539, partial [Phrynocephalus forsythii]